MSPNNTENSNRLKIAIQKSGRLSEKSLALLKECGIQITTSPNALRAEASNFPLEILFLRDDDIPEYVQDGVADVGIIGENVMLEKGKKLELIDKLGFAKCRLSLAVPRGTTYDDVSFFDGKRIATSYPKILGEYFKEKNVNAEIHMISGSVEIAPSIGLSEGVCDIVSSGSTLLSNGLKEVETVLKSEAVLVANPDFNGEKRKNFEKLLFRMQSVRRSNKNKYILLNAPKSKLDAIISVLPGLKSPTIMPLANEDWVSVHTVINEDDFWEKIDALQEAGAEGILVIPIEKMIV
ncbi:ATP phosphoribosyltransferase [Bernardetia sp. OM2101]|uniref:ATP phosphoribosyltransferase n=1 Tax=Bernardetia sp. OM2101 TaxID=3344876 RepID=UPI0035CF3583